jgi:hypothetical protein
MATCSQFFAPLKHIDASYPQDIFQTGLPQLSAWHGIPLLA